MVAPVGSAPAPLDIKRQRPRFVGGLPACSECLACASTISPTRQVPTDSRAPRPAWAQRSAVNSSTAACTPASARAT
ncbi:hypothetical protein KR76_00027 [Pimelobacter simplex]|uniref:Uncharacterized protein n=1 Tax=Nocardioides simplex TaxID=2045 RepID=A0A0C5XFY4_NOCSI|nr:hypothetical protein KR76_00027 [Pimelobacter simplex]